MSAALSAITPIAARKIQRDWRCIRSWRVSGAGMSMIGSFMIDECVFIAQVTIQASIKLRSSHYGFCKFQSPQHAPRFAQTSLVERDEQIVWRVDVS